METFFHHKLTLYILIGLNLPNKQTKLKSNRMKPVSSQRSNHFHSHNLNKQNISFELKIYTFENTETQREALSHTNKPRFRNKI